jgi:hypothetical protein
MPMLGGRNIRTSFTSHKNGYGTVKGEAHEVLLHFGNLPMNWSASNSPDQAR